MDKMLEANPKSVPARLARLRFFLRHPELAGDSAEAARAAEAKITLPEYQLAEALKIAPGDADARMLAAESAVDQGRHGRGPQAPRRDRPAAQGRPAR